MGKRGKKKRRHCNYCGRAVIKRSKEARMGRMLPDELTIDHVIPRSKGGSRGKANQVIACHSCNNEKGSNHLWQPRFYDDGTPRYDMTGFINSLEADLKAKGFPPNERQERF